MTPGIQKTLPLPYDAVLAKLPDALVRERECAELIDHEPEATRQAS